MRVAQRVTRILCFWPFAIILLLLRYYIKHLYLICTCKKK